MSEPHDFADAAAFETFLEAEHDAHPDGIWLRIAKKGSGHASVSHPEALDLALCFGWIDAQRKGLDDTHFLQRFVPRRARSRWSRINRAKAEALIAEGRMRPSGLAEVQRAKADGRWDAAYDGPAAATVPEDLRAALDATPAAAEAFAALDGRNRYAILHRTAEAKRPETRARRIAKFVELLARGETLHPRPPASRDD